MGILPKDCLMCYTLNHEIVSGSVLDSNLKFITSIFHVSFYKGIFDSITVKSKIVNDQIRKANFKEDMTGLKPYTKPQGEEKHRTVRLYQNQRTDLNLVLI